MCRIFCLFGLVVLLLAGISASVGAKELVILHTNDTHSNLFPFGPQKEHGGIARMSTLIQELRAENENVLALHAGDVFVGAFAFNKYLGYPELKIMEGLYDAMALGNHEFDLGPSALGAILEGVNPLTLEPMGPPVSLAILSANVTLDAALQPFIKPWLIKDVGGLKVGLVGVVTENPVYYAPDLAALFSSPYEAAGLAAAQLRGAGCHVVIAISHLGTASDVLGLSQVPGIDVIVGGHSHDRVSTEVNGKIIVQVGEFGEYLGELRIDVNETTGAVTQKGHTFHAINRELRESPALRASLNALRDGIYTDPRYGPVLSQHIATALWDLEKTWLVADPRRQASHRDTPLGNLVTDALRMGVDHAGYAVDCALEAIGYIGHKIYAGKVVGNDVMLSVPYGYDPNSGLGFKINVVSLYGAELLGGLEYTLGFVEYTDEMALQVSGLTFRYDSSQPAGSRLDPASVAINGIPLSPNGIYRVALNEKLTGLLAGLGLDLQGRVEATGLLEFNLVKAYMQELNHLHYTSQGRIIDAAALP